MMLVIFSSIMLLFANDIRLDPLSQILDASTRERLLQQQGQEFLRRVTQSNDCDSIFAPLPGPNGTTVPFINSHTLIEAAMGMIKTDLPRECQLQLAQNLQLLGNAGVRISNEILRYSSPQIASDAIFSCAPTESPIRDLLPLVSGYSQAVACNKMEVGEWSMVNKSAAFLDSISYGLTRDGQDSYRAVLNINFINPNDPASEAVMIDRVRQCMNGATPYMNGNVRGQGDNNFELKIDVLTGAEVNRLPTALRPRQHTIRISPPGSGNSVRNYSQDIPCSTIIHEVMHLLGLCDEYPGERDGFPCRPVGRPSSLMRNEALAFAEAVPQKISCECESNQCRFISGNNRRLEYALQPGLRDFFEADFLNQNCSEPQGQTPLQSIDAAINANTPRFDIRRVNETTVDITFSDIDDLPSLSAASVMTERTRCSCQTNDRECISFLAKVSDPADRRKRRPTTIICPGGSRPLRATVANRAFSSGVRNSSQGNTIELYSPSNRNSLIEPWHFNQIINGNCSRKTNFYDSCAQLSYQRNPQRCQTVLAEDSGANRVCMDRYNWGDYRGQFNEVARCRDRPVGNTRFVQCQPDREL